MRIHAWELSEIDHELISLALKEDLSVPYSDVTTDLLFEQNKNPSVAKIISKHPEPIILCGLPILKAIIDKLDPSCTVLTDFKDGDEIQKGEILLTLSGSAHTILRIERTLLNFLQHLCAVATITARFVKAIQSTSTQILDTRKTLPGFRHLDKYAVQCGGGVNHRMGLYDAIMIKDTHIDCLGGLRQCLDKLPEDILQQYPVIVEIRNRQELELLLSMGLNKVSRVLLDNMTVEQLTECVELCKNKILTEASGNISLENVLPIAQTGVNFVSIGKLTHSAGNVDLSMRCDIN